MHVQGPFCLLGAPSAARCKLFVTWCPHNVTQGGSGRGMKQPEHSIQSRGAILKTLQRQSAEASRLSAAAPRSAQPRGVGRGAPRRPAPPWSLGSSRPAMRTQLAWSTLFMHLTRSSITCRAPGAGRQARLHLATPPGEAPACFAPVAALARRRRYRLPLSARPKVLATMGPPAAGASAPRPSLSLLRTRPLFLCPAAAPCLSAGTRSAGWAATAGCEAASARWSRSPCTVPCAPMR